MKFRLLHKAAASAVVICLIISLSVYASAATGGKNAYSFDADFSAESLSDVIERYLSENKIPDSKFTMGFYDTVTGEEYYYNGDVYMEAGSMFKLPMNMIYAEKVYNGEMGWNDLAGDYNLGKGMELSIVYSNNAVSISMLNALADTYTEQRQMLGKYADFELDNAFYTDNNFSPRYVISVLKHLYENENGQYDVVIDYMKEASPTYGFAFYSQPYEVAHKYGSWNGNLNDCGIIYGPHPMLLVVFTYFLSNNEDVLSQVCRIVSDYSAYLGEKDSQAPSATPEPESAPTPAPTPAPASAEPVQSSSDEPVSMAEEPSAVPLFDSKLYACGAAAVLLVSAVVILSARRRKVKK